MTYILDALKPMMERMSKPGNAGEVNGLLKSLLGSGGPLSAFPGTTGDLVEAMAGLLGLASSEGNAGS